MNMTTNDSTTNPATPASPFARVHRGIWIGGALMGLTIVALATALVVKGNSGDGTATAPAATDATAAATASADGTAAATPVAPPANQQAQAQTQADTAPPPRPIHSTPAPATTMAPNAGYGANTQVAAAEVCASCGTVESYAAVQVEGQANGVGAVAGGVGGALIGSKIAGRGNHTVGGLIGAIGGGLLGNTIEKHVRTTTVYDVHVRMNDGSERTVRQSAIPTVGSHVKVEGNVLHRLPTPTTESAPATTS